MSYLRKQNVIDILIYNSGYHCEHQLIDRVLTIYQALY